MNNLPTFTVADIRSWGPCYDPVTGIGEDGEKVNEGYLPEDWEGNALDMLRITYIPAEDRLWSVLREKCIDNKTLRLFAVGEARQALSKVDNPDPRSVNACDVAERYAKGEATRRELDTAEAAAWAAMDAAESAARAASWDARAAARAAVRDAAWAAWAAVRDAAWDAAESAAWDAAWDAVRAAAREKQVGQLIKMLEGGNDA